MTALDVSGATVTLTLSPGVDFTDALTLTYEPTGPALQDLAGNPAASFATVPISNGTATLVFSLSSDRSNPMPLDGAFLSGPVYVFLDRADSADTVSFRLDGAGFRTENFVPWDMGGGSVTIAGPINALGTFGTGAHTVEAVADGSLVATASFEVGDPVDLAPPTLASAVGNGSSLVLTYNEALDDTSLPDPGDYTVASDGAPQTVNAIAVSGSTVTLTLSPGVQLPEVLTLTYSPAVSPLQDLAGNPAASFAAQAVSNTSATLLVSLPSDRSSPVPLEGDVLSGVVYIFLAGADSADTVVFRLDGAIFRTENFVPWDMGGTSGSNASPVNAGASFGAGTHVVDAIADGVLVATAVFDVAP